MFPLKIFLAEFGSYDFALVSFFFSLLTVLALKPDLGSYGELIDFSLASKLVEKAFCFLLLTFCGEAVAL